MSEGGDGHFSQDPSDAPGPGPHLQKQASGQCASLQSQAWP